MSLNVKYKKVQEQTVNLQITMFPIYFSFYQALRKNLLII